MTASEAQKHILSSQVKEKRSEANPFAARKNVGLRRHEEISWTKNGSSRLQLRRVGVGRHFSWLRMDSPPTGKYIADYLRHMNRNREPIWWLPLLRRMLSWGALSGLAVGAFFFVLLLFVAFTATLGDPDITIAFVVGVPACGVGGIIGLASGFFAPVREPKSPFQSQFFRGVVTNSLEFWLFSSFFSLLTFGLISIFFEPWLIRFPWENSIYALETTLFIASLWRAINRALRATKEKQS